PFEAQYVVPFAYRIRYYFYMSLREAVHLSELRSIPQGHFSYRKIAQEIAKQTIKKYPLLGKYLFKFVDYKEYRLERLEAFERVAKKAQSLGMKAFEE
ncbi:MAG: FAD-dependent thymidylate synthase, partial [Patescibacteria group bacterium]